MTGGVWAIVMPLNAKQAAQRGRAPALEWYDKPGGDTPAGGTRLYRIMAPVNLPVWTMPSTGMQRKGVLLRKHALGC
jgi:hypothetical protein